MPDTLSSSGLIQWLVGQRHAVGPRGRAQLLSGLYASIPILVGGVVNTCAVAILAAVRHPTILFLLWAALELVLGFSRLAVVLAGRRAQRLDQTPPVAIAVVLACAWAASVGFGACISIASADWALAIVTSVSAAGMISGICLRNFGTPRLMVVMMVLCLTPCAAAAWTSREHVLVMIGVQLPLYMAAIGSAAFRLNGMLVARMSVQEALEMSEAFNRSILESSPDYTLVLDEQRNIELCNRPGSSGPQPVNLIARPWLNILPPECRADGLRALEYADRGSIGRLHVHHADSGRWFDLAVSRVADGSKRTLIVARDITSQKKSEERALWMAEHDPLTSLPNRLGLQARLEALEGAGEAARCALLVLDVDDFKLINDTLGHDAGDALLCEFARRLSACIRTDDLAVRLGGDEFAIILQAQSDDAIREAVTKIFNALRHPFHHAGRTMECNTSIGACLYPRDGSNRSDLMKAADIALYAAKTAGRGQLKIFRAAMRNDIQSRNSTIYLARRALASGSVLPYYQPKVALRDGRIIGFEALFRWRDESGRLRLPDKLRAAFDDPVLSAAISDRMIEQTLADVRRWLDAGIEFGHVAINVAAAEFRSGSFAEQLLGKLEARGIAPQCLQIEITEALFHGRGADHVQQALRRLSKAGLRIALDDFGTGYASLAHLMQFPVDALKIDRSFIAGFGRNPDAEAITKAIINLGHSLGIETIAEGVERPEQEYKLIALGCQSAQGYLFSKAVPSQMVPDMLAGYVAKSA